MEVMTWGKKYIIDIIGIEISENQLKEAKQMVEESDIKYDEVARKLAMVEGDLERAEERAEAGESKIVDLEEELRVIGENLKALEVAEEKAQQREEEYKKQVQYRLKCYSFQYQSMWLRIVSKLSSSFAASCMSILYCVCQCIDIDRYFLKNKSF